MSASLGTVHTWSLFHKVDSKGSVRLCRTSDKARRFKINHVVDVAVFMATDAVHDS